MLNPGINRRPLLRSTRIAAVAVVLIMTLSIAGFAGQTFGSVSGTLVDHQSGVIPNATVAISNVDTHSKYEVRTDGGGHFMLAGLPAGDYLFEARFPGFSLLGDTLTLAPGQALQRHLTLQLGTLQETVTVAYVENSRGTGVPSVRTATAPTNETCTPAAVGGRIVPPIKVRNVVPDVPEAVRTGKIEGQVVLEAVIGTDGAVQDLRTMGPVDPDLEAAATAAVREWQFTPTTLNCVTVEVNMTVTVNFTLRQYLF